MGGGNCPLLFAKVVDAISLVSMRKLGGGGIVANIQRGSGR